MKVLVTGAEGQLGKTIKDLYGASEDISFVFTNKEVLNITNKTEVNSYLKKTEFSYCINCAAYTNVEKAEEEPQKAFSVNVEAVKNLALACKANNTTLLHISTDYVFDGLKNEPYTETDKPNPINVYGKSKLEGENEIRKALSNYFIIRTAWLYSTYENNFLNKVLYKIKNNEDLQIISSQQGTPTSCVELAKFLYFLISSKIDNYGTFNYTAEGNTTWFGFANQIASNVKEFNLEKIKPVSFFKTKTKRPQYSVLCLKKTRSIYPEIKTWRTSVDQTIQSLAEKQ